LSVSPSHHHLTEFTLIIFLYALDHDPTLLLRSFNTSYPPPHLPHIQTTHLSVTSLSRRIPRRFGGTRTSQANRSCTGLGFTMHHIDPLPAACCMLLLYCMKGKKHILITGLSVTLALNSSPHLIEPAVLGLSVSIVIVIIAHSFISFYSLYISIQ
jgi:hypothetical protein